MRGLRRLFRYRCADCRPGRATVLMRVGRPHCNSAGTVHGGVISTLLDVVGGYCANRTGESGSPSAVVTVALTIHFVKRASSRGLLRAEGTLRSVSGPLWFTAMTLHDAAGSVVAVATGVYRTRGRGAPASGNRRARRRTARRAR